jgi:hypothetical protein
VNLQVFDRGCGDWCTGTLTGDINTSDALQVFGGGGYAYHASSLGQSNFCQQKAATFTQDGVVVCQAPNLCTGVSCAAPGPCQQNGVCNPINGQCDYAPTADLSACSDADPTHSICLDGACAADPCAGVTCVASDQCHKPGVCDQLTGQCSNPKAPYGLACDDGDPGTDGTVCVSGVCQIPPAAQYATANLATGSTPMAFVFAPAGTVFNSDQDYDDWCTNHGFSGNRTGNAALGSTAPNYYDPNDYYCSQYCCFLGFGNGMSGAISNFVNFNLPEGQNLQVIDRGCGHWCTNSFNGDVNTTDALFVSGESSYQYKSGTVGNGGVNYCQPGKQVELIQDGVVVCQAPNLCTGVICAAPGPCQEAGVCNPVTGQCLYAPQADLSACSDSDPKHSLCFGGACATDPCLGVSCGGPIDQCHAAQVCDQHNGLCTNPNAPNGTPCDDNDPSTPVTTCSNGVCSASITKWSEGTANWPDEACNPNSSFGNCNTNDQGHADAWATAVCQLNGYSTGVWTGNKAPGCNGQVSMYCGGQIPCNQIYEFQCSPGDQTKVEITCFP